jgi:phage tail-like protein
VDGYGDFKYRLRWNGRYVAAVSTATVGGRALEATSAQKGRGRTEYEPVTLEKGVTHDPEFDRWANDASAQRRDLRVEVHDEAGHVKVAYKLFRCWVSEYQPVGDLDANANAVAIEHIKLENEGIERDTAVPEPAEPSFDVP